MWDNVHKKTSCCTAPFSVCKGGAIVNITFPYSMGDTFREAITKKNVIFKLYRPNKGRQLQKNVLVNHPFKGDFELNWIAGKILRRYSLKNLVHVIILWGILDQDKTRQRASVSLAWNPEEPTGDPQWSTLFSLTSEIGAPLSVFKPVQNLNKGQSNFMTERY